jgi:hypothetical protein
MLKQMMHIVATMLSSGLTGSRCYISKTRRPLEVCIEEQEYNLDQGLFEKSILTNMHMKEGHKLCWKEVKVLQTGPNIT